MGDPGCCLPEPSRGGSGKTGGWFRERGESIAPHPLLLFPTHRDVLRLRPPVVHKKRGSSTNPICTAKKGCSVLEHPSYGGNGKTGGHFLFFQVQNTIIQRITACTAGPAPKAPVLEAYGWVTVPMKGTKCPAAAVNFCAVELRCVLCCDPLSYFAKINHSVQLSPRATPAARQPESVHNRQS